MVDDLAAAKARLGRLQRDNKTAVAYRATSIDEAKTRVAAIERALAGLMEDAGRKKVSTDFGELKLGQSVSTAFASDVVMKWATDSALDAIVVTHSVTIASLEKAGASWKDGRLMLKGEVIPGIERTETPRAVLPSRLIADEEDGSFDE